MIKFFRKIRYDLMEKNKTGKYFKYAIGEIVLVVIGILIALSINNWNQERIQNNEISKIHQRIILDVNNDLRDLSARLVFWKEKELVFLKVVNDSISAELLDQGLSRLLVFRRNTNLNTTGVQQLKALNVKDRLSLRIIETYDFMENINIKVYEKKINDESIALISIFQDKYEWFPEFMNKTITKDNSSKELRDYFLKSMEYRNRVINGYWRIYKDYVPSLENYIVQLEEIRNELQIISDKDFKVISKKDLERYEGSFKIAKFEGNDYGSEIDDIYQITAHDNFLRVTTPRFAYYYNDYFYTKDNAFYSLDNNGELNFSVESDTSQKTYSFKMLIEGNNEKSYHYATKLNEEVKVQ
jgi:hypothetical protein